MATSIFEVIEGLTVTKEDIVEAELFAEQYLSAQFPTYDFRQGTALRDMTVRPNATLLALIQKAITFYFDESDLVNITNDTNKDVVDRKMSNFFISRKSGNSAVINARLYFSFPLSTAINTPIPANAFFSVDNEIKYFPQGNITVYANEVPGQYYFRYDSSMDMHYVDIPLESAGQVEAANIEEGDLLYFTVFSPYFLQAQVQNLVSSAVPEETNEEMVSRSYSAISTRNLINTPSIVARIGDQFNYVRTVYPVGLGHDWMYRDLIDIDDVANPGTTQTYHRGGHTDVFLDTNPVVQTAQLVAEADREIPGRNVFYINGPVYEIFRSPTPPAGADDDSVPIYLPSDPTAFFPFTYEVVGSTPYTDESIPEIPGSDLGLSAKQITKIVINNGSGISIGDTASFNFSVFQGVGSIHDSMNSREESVVTADYLGRSFEPVFIDLDITLRSTLVPADPSIQYDALKTYIESIPNGGTIYVAELINILIDNGIADFVMPLPVTATRYHRDVQGNQDGSSATTVTAITDTMNLNEIQKFYLRDVTYNKAGSL